MDLKITSKKLLQTFEFYVDGESGYITLHTADGYKQISKDGFVGDMMYAKNDKDFKNKCRKFIKNIVEETFGNTSENYYMVKSYERKDEIPENYLAFNNVSNVSTSSISFVDMMRNLNFDKKDSEDHGVFYSYAVYRLAYDGCGGVNKWELCKIF